MPTRFRVPRIWAWSVALAATLIAAPAFAGCSIVAGADNIGTYSPAAVKNTGTPTPASAVPYTLGTAGFTCTDNSVLKLSLVNYLRATIPTGTVLKLTSTTTSDTIDFKVAANASGSSQLVVGTQFSYVSGLSLDLLGVGGTGAMNTPIYIKPGSTATVAPGVYTATLPINWSWYFCSGVYVTGCSVTPDQGSGAGSVSITLTVAQQVPTMTVSSVTTWDPISTTTNPKALPGSRRRTTITVTNIDVVALASNGVVLTLPTAPGTVIALDGDKSASNATITSAQGSPASGLTLSYVSPGSTTDDVDFSSDGGTTWTASPTAGDDTSQATINRVRFRPQGAMAVGSSFQISLPYSVK